jgi:hypothetical protein
VLKETGFSQKIKDSSLSLITAGKAIKIHEDSSENEDDSQENLLKMKFPDLLSSNGGVLLLRNQN